MRDKPVTRIMTTPPVVVEATTPMSRARQLMAKHGIHHLPVVTEGQLAGILSTADLSRREASDTVGQAMQPQPISVAATATIQDAARVLASGMFHALPVVDASAAVVGVVTSSDLIKALLQQLTVDNASAAAGHDLPAGAFERFTDPGELEAAVHAAGERHRQGADADHLAAAVLYLNARVRQLEAVLDAADLYLHSGHGEREHRDLVLCVQRAREKAQPAIGTGRL